jgi:putative PIG3 family NAD(P)H quinone oxidoreductase
LAATIVDGRIEVATRSVPEPAGDDVLVRVHGAGLNRADLLQREGRYPAPPGVPPDVPGLEFAGVVERCGPDATGVSPGDRVFGVVAGGAQAEYLVAPAAHCAPVPPGLDLVAMGAVPEAFITAHDALVTQARVQPGEWVLVDAVGSGVGTATLQLARVCGARVIGTARTPAKLDRSRALGLDHGIVPPVQADGSLDIAGLAFEILEATDAGADVVIDLVGGAYAEAAIAAAAPLGRIVLVGALAGATATLPIVAVMGKRLTIHGTVLRPRDKTEKAAATAAFTRDVVPLLAAGTIAPVIDAVLPLEQIEDAYALVASDATFGKVVLNLA